MKLTYTNRPTTKLADDELKEYSELFNNNYGFYRDDSSLRPGESVRFPMSKYRSYVHDDFYVAEARCDGRLIAHAFYIRKKYRPGIMTWVLQLVVMKEYRGQGIASKLLHSIWGFSNDYAWGLATANPCTVKTLESATFRNCRPQVMLEHIDEIKLIGKDTTYINDEDYEVTHEKSIVNTHFWIDNSSMRNVLDVERYLGELPAGYEWLAMTFQTQKPDKSRYASRLNKLLSFSEDRLKEAYARMDMDNHLWASKTVNEVDFISNYLTGTTILDLGCGRGRHSIELAKREYTVTGIDFVESNIAKAKERSHEEGLLNTTFLVDDIRGTRFGSKYDAVICLYDVIGSFANENDNKKVLRSAYNNLAENGVFILSVLNMELTEKLVPDDNRISIKRNPERLFSLSPQNHMQKQGEIFDGQNMLIDIDTGLVIRKEQFDRDNALSAEYIVRDKRYRMDEIVELVESIGFSVIHTQYTHAGFSDSLEATDNRAKEILIVAQKC